MNGYIVTTDREEAPSRILEYTYQQLYATSQRQRTYTNSTVTTPQDLHPAGLQEMSQLELYLCRF
jgi:hypothetical protein